MYLHSDLLENNSSCIRCTPPLFRRKNNITQKIIVRYRNKKNHEIQTNCWVNDMINILKTRMILPTLNYIFCPFNLTSMYK